MNRRSLWFGVAAVALAGTGLAAWWAAGRLRAPEALDDASDPMGEMPRLMLWAWERPEDLRFIDTERVGVAYLARTLVLRGDRVVVRSRRQPLATPENAVRLVVVRVESDRAEPPTLTESQRRAFVGAILPLVRGVGMAGVQVDFDATTSQTGFYADALRDLRAGLPVGRRLSMTALASWCLSKGWLDAVPVDEAVPMLFRMGADGDAIRNALDSGMDFRPPVARRSVGVSTDETIPDMVAGRRVYAFHPRPWTPDAVDALLRRMNP